MTMPNERTRAVQNAEVFLCKLLDPKLTPRIPKAIRLEACWILKHFPGVFDLEEAARKAPDHWGAPIIRSAWDRVLRLREIEENLKTSKRKRRKKEQGP